MSAAAATSVSADAWIEVVRERVRLMRFGTINITIHDGRVTQVDATERTRLAASVPREAAPSRPPSSPRA